MKHAKTFNWDTLTFERRKKAYRYSEYTCKIQFFLNILLKSITFAQFYDSCTFHYGWNS